MSITQVGVATISDELLQYIKNQIKNGTIDWGDLTDTPDYAGQNGKFLKAVSGGGSASMIWENLPAAGLNWRVQSTNVTATDKVGYLASNGITITLPAAPLAGNLVAIADKDGEFDTKPITVIGNGKLIEGDSTFIVDLRNAYVQLIYDGTGWHISQVNSPFNIQEITEETFAPGQVTYTMSRIPPSRSSLLITTGGSLVPTGRYSIAGNLLTFDSVQTSTVFVRHIGVPAAVAVSDTPIGAMLYFPNNSPVDGWLDCTGGSIGKSIYPDLVKYLTKSDDAQIAYLPDARGNFIRTWDAGSGIDSVSPQVIPTVLKDHVWGKGLGTTDPTTENNLWDANLVTRTTVKFSDGRVGYAFDAPVSVSQASISTDDAVGTVHVPTSVVLQASTDGVTWVDASAPYAGTIQNRTVVLESTNSNPYRFWSVKGTGGSQYTNGTGRYWGVTSLVFVGTSTNRVVGGYQDESVGPMQLSLNSVSSGVGQVQSGTGAVVPLSGTTGAISGGEETRPRNQAYVLRIKAFHYQSGALGNTEVTSLRGEVSRLATQVSDGRSYVSAVPPLSPVANARWYDTMSGRTYIWFNDGDSTQWVDDSPQSTSSARESINAADVLSVGSNTARPLNARFSDIKNILDFGGLRNSVSDSKPSFDRAGVGPVFVPHGSYYVSSGDYTGNVYFSFGPVTLSGAYTGIVIKDLLA